MTIINSSTPLRKRPKHDLYETPLDVIESAMGILKADGSAPMSILDPGCGDGRWGESAAGNLFAGTYPRLVGVDIREVAPNPCYMEWHSPLSFLEFEKEEEFDLIVGNP